MSTRKPNRVNQHEPLRVPQGWNDQSRALVMQIDRLLDDVYTKLGKIQQLAEALPTADQISRTGDNPQTVEAALTSINSQLIRLNPYEPTWTANADLNNYTQTGTYYLSTGRQNGVGGDWGMLQVIGGRADTFNQIYRANGRIFEREYRTSNGWTAWKELADVAQLASLRGLSEAKNTATDLNNNMYAGAYMYNRSTANTPTDYGVCFVVTTDQPYSTGIGWVAQLAFPTTNNWKLYLRTNINNTGWTAWKSITFS